MPRSIPVMQSRRASRRSWWRALLCAALALQLCSCGTLLYPNRHGQARAGQMDPAVVVMDGVLLILFIVPGVIAFAVDFSTGAIYLPGKGHARVAPPDAQPLALPNPDPETLRFWLGAGSATLHDAAMFAVSASRG